MRMLWRLSQNGKIVLSIVAAICVVNAIYWLPEIISLFEPKQAILSGCTGESLHCIWKVIHGEAVYTDMTKMPFSSSYFNWIYYLVYGYGSKSMLALLDLDEIWVPSLAASISLMFTVLGIIFAAKSYHKLSCTIGSISRWEAMAFAVIVFLGPIMVSWNLAQRPDVGALTLEVMGLWAVLKALRSQSRDIPWWIFASLLFAGAWGFRIINVQVFGGVMLWLLVGRQWRNAILLFLPFTFVAGATFLIGGKEWVENALLGNIICPFGFSHLLYTVKLAFFKASYMVIPLIFTIWFGLKGAWKHSTTASLWFYILLVSITITVLTALKYGSHQNYWFTVSFASAGLIAYWWGCKGLDLPETTIMSIRALVAVCLIFTGAVQLAYLFDVLKTVQKEDQARLMTLRESLLRMPEPIVVRGGYFENLPWITSQDTPFVYAYTYHLMRNADVPLERNGLGGLVREGYFGTIVYPVEYAHDTPTDGQTLDLYQVSKADAFYRYYVRKE
jgi:hypothetical protein